MRDSNVPVKRHFPPPRVAPLPLEKPFRSDSCTAQDLRVIDLALVSHDMRVDAARCGDVVVPHKFTDAGLRHSRKVWQGDTPVA